MIDNAVDSKITVVALCSALNGVGGINRHLLNLYLNINRSKYRFLIAYCSNKEVIVEKFFLEGGVRKEDLFCFPVSKETVFILLIIRLRRLFIRENVDILHTFFLHSDIIGFFSAVLSGKRCLISSVEGKFLLDEVNGVNKLKQACYMIVNSLIRRFFYRTIAVSSALKDEIISCYKPAVDSAIVVNVGISIPSDKEIDEVFSVRMKRGYPVIATIARFSKDKRLECFLHTIPQIAKEIPEARFVIAGSGDQEIALRLLAEDLGILSIVSFHGWVNDIKKFMEGIDVFVMTSVREGCPNALLEALSFSIPVIAFEVPGVKEIIINGENGILVEPFDLQKFSSSVIGVCRDSERAEMLGENGRRLVKAKFSIAMEVKKIELLYSESLNFKC